MNFTPDVSQVSHPQRENKEYHEMQIVKPVLSKTSSFAEIISMYCNLYPMELDPYQLKVVVNPKWSPLPLKCPPFP